MTNDQKALELIEALYEAILDSTGDITLKSVAAMGMVGGLAKLANRGQEIALTKEDVLKRIE